MRISIVTPSYNQAAFLEATILSVLEQDYEDIEYIVIDGGSIDGSMEIIKNYASRLSYWVSEKDSGQAEAINKGFARITGDIVAWINSDDMYRAGALSEAATAFQRRSEIGLCFGNVDSIDQHGQIFNLQTFRPCTLSDLMSFNIISQPGVFMRRAVLEQAGFLDTSYHYLLDHHLWLRMARLAALEYIPKTLAAARYHPEAKNVSRAGEFGQEAYRIVEWMQTDDKFSAAFDDSKRRIWAGAHRLNAFYLTDSGQPKAGLKYYVRSLMAYPFSALRDWKHVLDTLFLVLGFGGVRKWYIRLRTWFTRMFR